MKAEEEDKITEEARLKAEEHKRAYLKVEEEVLLALESIRQADYEDRLQLKAEEKARIVEEARMEAEEEERAWLIAEE